MSDEKTWAVTATCGVLAGENAQQLEAADVTVGYSMLEGEEETGVPGTRKYTFTLRAEGEDAALKRVQELVSDTPCDNWDVEPGTNA